MSVYNKRTTSRRFRNVRSAARWLCLAGIFFCIFCWEPILGGALGSPAWTVFTILFVVALVAQSCYFSYLDVSETNAMSSMFLIKSGAKLIAALVVVILLIIIGVKAGRIDSLPTDVSASDIVSITDVVVPEVTPEQPAA